MGGGRVTLDDSVQMLDEVVSRELEGETVVLHLDSGTYFGLDPVATRIWNLMRDHGVLRKVLDVMLEEYDVAAEALQCDLLAFVEELRRRGLIAVTSAVR